MSPRRHPIAGGVAVIAFGYLWIPILAVAVYSLNSNSLVTQWGGVTAHWYSLALSDSNVRAGLGKTFEIAVHFTVSTRD